MSTAEKKLLDIITSHPMISRAHLVKWLAVSEGRMSQMMASLCGRWELVERHGSRGAYRYTLSAAGIRYITARDRAKLQTTRGIWSTDPSDAPKGKRRYAGHLIDTWSRQKEHSDGITWLLSRLAVETKDEPDSALLWSVPAAWSERKFAWNASAITPDAVGMVKTRRRILSFFLEYEKRVRHPKGAARRLRPYERYYTSYETTADLSPLPLTLFVVDSAAIADTYVNTALSMPELRLPILVACIPNLDRKGILGRSWQRLWEPDSPPAQLSELDGYTWDRLYGHTVKKEER